MNLKKLCIFLGVCIVAFCVCGCELPLRKPISVTFYDVSGAMSTDHTISIKIGEEKDYEDYFIDILIKSDTNVELTIFQEFSKKEDKVTIQIDKDAGYVSLDEYKIFNMEQEQTDSMVGYSDVLATNLVINSSADATLTILAVVGEKNAGEFKQVGIVSKEYTLNVKKHKNN